MFRVSLRGMLILVAFFAIAIVSLVYANDFWVSVVTGILMVAFLGALIVAFVDRGFSQAFAIGFVLAILTYGIALFSERSTRGGNVVSNDRLPATRTLNWLYRRVERGGYVDASGKPLPNYNPANDPRAFPGGGGFVGAGGFNPVYYRQLPDDAKFRAVGHCWWALLLGYGGGMFAMYVHRRRMRNEEKLPADIS
jgi:Zn-dependent protease with chaperone function